MRRRLITAGVVLGGIVLAACGSAGPGVQARRERRYDGDDDHVRDDCRPPRRPSLRARPRRSRLPTRPSSATCPERG